MVSFKPNARKNPIYKFEGDQDAYLDGVKEDYEFMVKNKHKQEREQWVVETWLRAKGIAFLAEDLSFPEQDPPDMFFKGHGIEIVEVMEPGRKRDDEYKEDLQLAEKSQYALRWTVSIPTIADHAHEWIIAQIRKKAEKYQKKGIDSQSWILLVYANFCSLGTIQWHQVKAYIDSNPLPFKAVEVLRGDHAEFSCKISKDSGNKYGHSNIP